MEVGAAEIQRRDPLPRLQGQTDGFRCFHLEGARVEKKI